MTEQFKNDNPLTPSQAESDVFVLIKKIQQQLDSLERKIDTLTRQSYEKPFREKNFSKPFRSSGRPYRPGQYPDKREQREDSRERNFRPGRHFEKHQGDENQGFSGPKKSYTNEQGNSSSQDGYFKKKYGGEKGGSNPKKKHFFHKHKD
jgi:hypothetical protein